MNARKAGWLITAALLMLYVVAGYLGARSAEAATLAEIGTLKNLFYSSRVKMFKNKTIAFYSAVSGSIATCHVATASKSLAVLNQEGWYLSDVTVIELPEQTEKGCYDRAAAY